MVIHTYCASILFVGDLKVRPVRGYSGWMNFHISVGKVAAPCSTCAVAVIGIGIGIVVVGNNPFFTTSYPGLCPTAVFRYSCGSGGTDTGSFGAMINQFTRDSGVECPYRDQRRPFILINAIFFQMQRSLPLLLVLLVLLEQRWCPCGLISTLVTE